MNVNKIPWMPEPILTTTRTWPYFRRGDHYIPARPQKSIIMQYWETRVAGDRCGTYSEDCPICGANLQRGGLVDEIGLDHTYGEYACGSVSAIATIDLSRSRSIVAAYVSDMCAEIAGLYTEDEI